MASTGEKTIIRREATLTPRSDKKGRDVYVCVPEWFDDSKKYKITNAPPRTASLEFTGTDLNFMARVLYAEASGAQQLRDKAERDREKSAIMNVNHFRLNRKGYPNRTYIATSFEMVCMAPGQFESVFGTKPKFLNSTRAKVAMLGQYECSDLEESLAAVRAFLANGPDPNYRFDGFRGYNPKGDGKHIGRSRFFLSTTGERLANQTP